MIGVNEGTWWVSELLAKDLMLEASMSVVMLVETTMTTRELVEENLDSNISIRSEGTGRGL